MSWVVVGFVVAAAAGTAVRVGTGHAANRDGRPLGTLGVNLLGSLLLGLLAGAAPDASWTTVLGTAGLGALTTFSTFVAEVVLLVRAGDRTLAVAYLTTTVGACTAAAWVGLLLT